MATLNEIADSILIEMQKPFDADLKAALKFTIKIYRARLLRQELARDIDLGLDSQHMVIKLKTVDKADTCVANVGCTVLRTVNKVPKPLKLKNDELFEFVGNTDASDSFIRTRLHELPFTYDLIYTGKARRYDYINNYLYIFNVPLNQQRNLRVTGHFADPTKVKDDCSEVTCYSDDNTEFPLSDHLISVLIDMILNKQIPIESNTQEVKVDG